MVFIYLGPQLIFFVVVSRRGGYELQLDGLLKESYATLLSLDARENKIQQVAFISLSVASPKG